MHGLDKSEDLEDNVWKTYHLGTVYLDLLDVSVLSLVRPDIGMKYARAIKIWNRLNFSLINFRKKGLVGAWSWPEWRLRGQCHKNEQLFGLTGWSESYTWGTWGIFDTSYTSVLTVWIWQTWIHRYISNQCQFSKSIPNHYALMKIYTKCAPQLSCINVCGIICLPYISGNFLSCRTNSFWVWHCFHCTE